MTFVVDGDQWMANQMIKQLPKIVDFTKSQNLYGNLIMAREITLSRVATTPETRTEIVQFVDLFRSDTYLARQFKWPHPRGVESVRDRWSIIF